jgi:hypothetical protein
LETVQDLLDLNDQSPTSAALVLSLWRIHLYTVGRSKVK